MVTCAIRSCRVRLNLVDGYCVTHARTNHDEVDTAQCLCGQCKELVPEDSSTKAIMCNAEKCKVWYHLSCTNLNEALYELINSASNDDVDNGIRWLCPKCRCEDFTIALVPAEDPVIQISTNKGVCNKLKHGSCPHGISGKTEHRGKVCDFLHPKLCKKYTRYGSGGRYGCKMTEKN